MAKYRQDQAWWGLAAKGGGHLFVAGLELIEGGVINAENTTAKNSFQILSVKLGLGLGGSAGLCAVFIFNCSNMWIANGTDVKDWGANVALGEKWSDFVKGLKNFGLLARAAKLGSKLKGLTPADIEDGRNLLHYVWNGYDLATGDASFKIITLDIPGSGIGYELSAAFTQGKLEVLS
jgi:hypothetical protein